MKKEYLRKTYQTVATDEMMKMAENDHLVKEKTWYGAVVENYKTDIYMRCQVIERMFLFFRHTICVWAAINQHMSCTLIRIPDDFLHGILPAESGRQQFLIIWIGFFMTEFLEVIWLRRTIF